MNSLRINSSLYVTVLSASLCLLAAGAPAAARQVTGAARQPVVARVFLKLSAAPGREELKLDGRGVTGPAASLKVRAEGNLYQNTKALTEIERVLTVNTLARASLS